MAWFGGAVVVGGLVDLLVAVTSSPLPGAARVLGLALLLVGAVCFGIGLLGVVWLPRALTPQWFRSWRDAGANRSASIADRYLTAAERRAQRSFSAAREREFRRDHGGMRDGPGAGRGQRGGAARTSVPSDANAHLADVRAQSWLVRTVVGVPDGASLRVLRAGTRGIYLPRPAGDGTTSIDVLPARVVLRALVRLVEGRGR